MKKWVTGAAICLLLTGFGLVGWAVFLPSSHGILDRIGVLGPMRATGLPIPDANGGANAGGPQFQGGGAIRVIAQEVTTANAGGRLVAIGTAQALRSVTLTSEVSGTLEDVMVSSGEWVDEGTLIAQLNSDVQQLALARAELGLRDTEVRAARVAQLRDSGSATQVQIDDAELAQSRAQLDLRDAQLELSRRQIAAPVSGWIGLITLEPGNQVTPNTELVRLDDRSQLLVNFDVPERFVGLVNVGDTLDASPLSRPNEVLAGRVRAIDARVDQGNRTLRIQGEIDNDGDRLRPGMAFRITMPLPGEYHPVVDPLAIQWDRGGAFVWALDSENRASRAGIEIIQRRDDAVLVRADLSAGDSVVLEGVQNLRPGAEVDIAEMRAAPATPSDADIAHHPLPDAEQPETPPDI
ncbi:efflux RND transporter periplasmic adaptor subunit [Roseinatronobacter sp. S2]|uniref:efflux RND transporter periplasmic adaptor subunit n=1 Tax=Roseinatronobacter sp. S2 TaxID=3035471 RepID=UPI00240F204A|nr:efflux RND transporter periplasmic adaptor subunit [Roseinatronobacter sp. S2]WFE74965.1 efflux RND transporter periplasmic adaptor subunit [Roseinatronobacter sp. S2]